MTLGHVLISSCAQLFWPAHCAGCDVVLHSDSAIFCGHCAQAVNPIGAACLRCALPGWQPARNPPRPRCAGCMARDLAFSRAFAACEYGEAMASAIMRMKHGGRPDLANRLGRILEDTMARALDPATGEPVDAVLPVPLHPRKLRQRGFNQALELARVALRRMRAATPRRPGTLPVLERRLLVRIRETRQLGRSGPGARQAEVFGAFAVVDRARVAGRRFLVVDDVMTTGATLNECAETLVRAGAREVRVVALARAT